MTNYEEMSDFEINKLVAGYWLSNGKYMDIFRDIEGRSDVSCFLTNMEGESINVFIGNFCESPSDAWPIIVENRIDIQFIRGDKCRAYYDANTSVGDHPYDFSVPGDNALRCAMIVYLKMQESSDERD